MSVLPISIICTIAAMIIGAIWYAPQVFGAKRAKLAGTDINDKNGVTIKTGISIFANLVLAFWLCAMALFLAPFGFDGNIVMTLMMAMGLMIVSLIMSNHVLEGRPPKLFLINAGHLMVVIIVMSFIITKFLVA